MFAFSAAFCLAAGAVLLGFAIHPKLLEDTHRALRDFMFLAFRSDVNAWSPDDALSGPVRLGMALVGAALVFASGAVMA